MNFRIDRGSLCGFFNHPNQMLKNTGIDRKSTNWQNIIKNIVTPKLPYTQVSF